MHRIVATCACAAALLVIGGGGSGRKAITRERVAAFARAVNLREGDLGPPSGQVRGNWYSKRFVAQITRCGGVLPGIEAGSIASQGYVHRIGFDEVSSAVRVADSRDAALRRGATSRTAPFRECVAAAYRGEQVGKARTRVTVSPLENGFADGFGLTITVASETLPGKGPASITVATRSTTDILGFVVPPAEVTLTFTQPNASRVRAAQRLLALLYSRAINAAPLLSGKRATHKSVLIIE